MFTFLLIVQTIVAASLVIVILMQRSEGGGLVASSSGSLMTARGAADFLTRATAVLGTLFIVLSIALAGLAAVDRAPTTIDPSLAGQPAAPVQAPGGVPTIDPLAGLAPAAPAAGTAAPAANAAAPAPETNGAVPLAQ
ncbi:MAG TPA: preprotein translocase subunit SecG [Allosphingosinicella sp.]|uniref:preprotein translocase subunit SecG n=1 Tax=Allosphingosinicella sp. TaxID=2823234 RepID=UPI002ED95880